MYFSNDENNDLMKILFLILFSITLSSFLINESYAHQSGCHGWHSCPSDSGSYTCGDKGYCSQCYDNAYCKDRQVRGAEPIQSFERSDPLEDYSYFSPLRVGVIVFFVGLIVIVVIAILISNGKKK